MVTPDMVLRRLPAYQDEWELIKNSQYVPDIINEVCAAHQIFAGDYDCFSDLFYSPDPFTVADNLFNFCRSYLKYREEPVKSQTTALPAGILERGYITREGVDCKHYSLFCAGVIASLNRLYNCCYDADFYFVAYRRESEPYHVYVSLKSGDVDIWIDPTPGSGGTPTLVIPRKV